jgi:predicted outer membrane lipoprotein
MGSIYKLIQTNPEYFAWAFGLVNALWLVFVYFNRQSHEKSLERLKSTLQLQHIEIAPLLVKLAELEETAGEANEIVRSYKSTKDRRTSFWPLRSKLEQLAGQLSKYPKLMQAVHDFNHYSAILVQDDPHKECREEAAAFFKVLLSEAENVRQSVSKA